MNQSEIQIGGQYLFVNNGNRPNKIEFHNQIVTVMKRIKGKTNKKAYFRNDRGKKPDKFLLDVGIYANAANLRLTTDNPHR